MNRHSVGVNVKSRVGNGVRASSGERYAVVPNPALIAPRRAWFVPRTYADVCTCGYNVFVTMPEKVSMDDRMIALQVIVPERDGLRILKELGAAGDTRPLVSTMAMNREQFGDIVVDPMTRTVHRGDRPVALSPKLFDLLLALVRRRGAVMSRAELLAEVWHRQDPRGTRTVDTHVFELRKRVEANPAEPRHILTVSKVGYRLQV
jgi:DNA-binding winged helix-turn-helix (wHTH) protein